MKPLSFGSIRNLFFASVVFCALGASSARATCSPICDDTNPDGSIKVTNMNGSFSLFTVLTSGDLNDTNNTFTGPSLLSGNIGIGGHGSFSVSDGTIDGDIYLNSFGSVTFSGPAHFTAGHSVKHNQDSTLNNALAGALYLSQQAAMETSTNNYTVNGISQVLTTVNTGNSITLDPTSSGKVVLNLQDFVMTSGTFTLEGTAMNTYIINVSRNFSLNNSKIVLDSSMGLVASHVLFNILGTGSQVSLQQGTSMQGILLAYDRKVDLSGGKVFGRIVAEQLAITSGGQAVSQ